MPFCHLTTLGLFILKFLAFRNSDIVINMITQRVLISLLHRRIEECWSRSHRVFFLLWLENLPVFLINLNERNILEVFGLFRSPNKKNPQFKYIHCFDFS